MSQENRIDQCFERLRESGKSAFVAYIAAGDPTMDRSLEIMHALESAGADIIELGIPFSDPMADGIVNQMAAHRALEAGGNTKQVLELIRRFRETSETPIVLFTYLNPVYTYGFSDFHNDATAAGADGILLLDLPPEEAAINQELAENSGLKHIRLIAPTSPAERIPDLAKSSEGFIYYVSREGVTGAQTSLAEGIAQNVAAIKAHTDVPIVVGFGISTPEQAAEVASSADGVVVGSAIVRIVAEYGDTDEVASKVAGFVKPLVDGAKSV
ncbi:tryptophan synthase subunit alpha [Verrucomicrobiales bacterium BCK34]|nr:tryptophan synthase subunit alpha [Verrucomicrobiales bacterium BCK34]